MNFLPDRPARIGQPLYLYLRGLLLWWLLPLAFSAAIAVAVSVHELYEDQAIRAQRWARNLANALDLELIRRLEGLRTVAALTTVGQRSNSLVGWAQSASSYHQHFGMPIMLVDADRKMLRHSRHPADASLPALPESQGRAAFEQALETGQAQIGDPVLGPMLGKPVVHIMLPLPEQGQMLVGAVPSDVLDAILASQDLPRGWRATLLDSVGREVAATGLEDEQDLPFPPSARRASSALSAAPFQVVLDVGPAVFYKDAIFLGGLMIFSVLVMLTLLAQSARRASLGLAASVRQLIDPADQSALLADVPKIAEIEAARIGLAAARAAEQSSRAREQFIFQLSDSLRLLTDAGSIQEEGCRALAQFLDVQRVCFTSFDEGTGISEVVCEALRGTASSALGDYTRVQMRWVLEPMAGGQPLAITDTHSSPWLSPEGRAFCEADGIRAYLGTPVLKDGRLVAVLCVTQDHPRSWSGQEQLLVHEVGRRLSASTERAKTFEALSARTLELASQTRQLRWLAAELTLAEHKTREKISKALHDHLQQILFSASLTLQRAIAKYPGDPVLEQTKLGLKEAMEAARSLSLEVCPPALRSEGLVGALRWLAAWMQKKYGFHVEVLADPQADPQALELRILLFECVRELLFNVVKHAQAHHVTISVSAEPGPMVQIILADDGIGFDSALAFKSGAEAPGLGLLSIRERLALLGGEMRVDSSLGSGSRFTLRAPDQVLQQRAHVPVPQALIEDQDTAAPYIETSAEVLRIILVDDHAMVRAGLRQLIISLPHLEVVGEAVNGTEAVAMARELGPDVVVMDKSMPVLGGVAATRKILADNPAIVVLGMSMDDGDVLQQFEQAGAAGFFSKKDGAELLLQRLEIERLLKQGGGGGPDDPQMAASGRLMDGPAGLFAPS